MFADRNPARSEEELTQNDEKHVTSQVFIDFAGQ
jgi:hypothetical protein